MKTLNRMLAAAVLSLPLIAMAQAVKPADQPRSDLEKTQTTDTGQATKYGGPGTDTSGAKAGTPAGTTSGAMSSDKSSMKHKGMKHGSADTTKAGDVPTYPAPAKDGTPTK